MIGRWRAAGRVVSGGGRHSLTQHAFGDRFERALGWRPYPGSLNVEVPGWPEFVGAPDFVVEGDPHTYQMWKVRVYGLQVPVCWMIPSSAPVPTIMELLAPVRLRGLVNEDLVVIRRSS